MASHTERRVVVTGIGVVSPLGNDLDTLWKNLVAGKCGIQRITQFDASTFDTQIAAEVGYESEASFNRAFKREFELPPARFRSQSKSARRRADA